MFNKLKDFLISKMRMSGPYQPVIIKCLLENNGQASLDVIAKELAANDPEAIGYYKEKLKIFPKKVLKRTEILNEDKLVEGFNLGFNVGHEAGQTVFHVHFHVIPRRKGDVTDPTGGIRNVIPGMGKY